MNVFTINIKDAYFNIHYLYIGMKYSYTYTYMKIYKNKPSGIKYLLKIKSFFLNYLNFTQLIIETYYMTYTYRNNYELYFHFTLILNITYTFVCKIIN